MRIRPGQLQSAVPAFFSGCMVCKFTELRLRVGSAAIPTELGGLLPKLENLSTLHSSKVVFHASTNCFLFLSTSRLVPFCSCFLAFWSAFISFALFNFFSFVLLLFSASVRAFLFPSVCFFFAPLVPFSPLSFFLSPVSLALLLPPLSFFSS